MSESVLASILEAELQAGDRSFKTLLSSYVQTRHWPTKYHAYQRMQERATAQQLPYLGRAAFELSVTANSQPKSDKLLLEATRFVSASSRLSPKRADIALEAAMLEHNFPLQLAVHVEKKHPSLEQIQTAHRAAALAVRTAILAPDEKDIKASRTLVGSAAEALVLIMMQRYATEQIQEEGWTPIPALLTEDSFAKKHPHPKSNWDISVFSNPDATKAPTYKTQVKWRPTPDVYESGISIVNVCEDLRLEGESTLRLRRLMFDATSHIAADSRTFNEPANAERTELLLNILDQAA